MICVWDGLSQPQSCISYVHTGLSTQKGVHQLVSFCITVLIMFRIMPFCCISWLNIVLNSLRKMDSCCVVLIGCWWCVTVREFEDDGGSGPEKGCMLSIKGRN